MGEPTNDELLADAIATVALEVLDRLADVPDSRSRFVHDLLNIMARQGAGESTEAMRLSEH